MVHSQNALSKSPLKNGRGVHRIPQSDRAFVRFYLQCRGDCRGNGQTLFGEAFTFAGVIRVEPSRAVTHEGKCGNCGGEVALFRDIMPSFAESFKLVFTSPASRGREEKGIKHKNQWL